mgnify:CR=1 FL=1
MPGRFRSVHRRRQGTFGTERDDDVAHTHRRDFTGGFFGRALIGDADSGDGFGFGFIRGDRVQRFEQSGGELRGRGRVQDDLLAQPVRHHGGGLDGLHRDFELQQDDIGRFDCLGRPFQVVGGEMRVGAGSDDDAVLSVGIHGNQGHARRVFRVGKYIRGVDPLFVEQLVGLVPEDVAACFADEGDPSARRATVTAWLAPLPPGFMKKVPPMTVSPGRGKCPVQMTISVFELPITRIFDSDMCFYCVAVCPALPVCCTRQGGVVFNRYIRRFV